MQRAPYGGVPERHSPTTAPRCRVEAARPPATGRFDVAERIVRNMAAVAVLCLPLPLVPTTSEGQEPQTQRSSELPISQLTNEHPVMKAALRENEEDSPALREVASWSEICDHDDLTGQTDSCWLRSPMYSAATSTAPGFYTAMLLVYCDGAVQVVTDRGRVNADGIPVPGEPMRPTRVILKGQVQGAADPARNTLFVSGSAEWAGSTLAFEARHSDNSTAVWRLPFSELERRVVEGFLDSPKCPRVEPEFPEFPEAGPVIVPAQKTSGTDPPLPKEARRAGVRGFLYLRLTVSETGDVVDVEVTREIYLGRPGRDHGKKRRQAAQELTTAAAVAAVRQWKYRPATLDGEPVAVHHNVTVRYGY